VNNNRRTVVVAPAEKKGGSSSDPPLDLRYASAYRTKIDDPMTPATFLGQYEIEEKEDRDGSTTLVELAPAGVVKFGQTSGPPFSAARGRWEFTGDALIIELTREYETYSTMRVLVGDVFQLDRIPPLIMGRIKTEFEPRAPADYASPLPPDDEPVHPTPDDAVGFFIAGKIPANQVPAGAVV